MCSVEGGGTCYIWAHVCSVDGPNDVCSGNNCWIADGALRPDTNNHGTAEDPPGLSIFDAIQEQLGLKLETKKDATELLVIDSVSKTPTSN
jgi:hypothetical protein